jgi:xanthine dehydrogenase accessory factor
MSVPQVESRSLASRCEGAWLAPLSGHWIDAARAHLSRNAAVVRVTVTALRGSAPREPGASLLVGALGTVGTIGGGRLEWHATSLARQLLLESRAAPVRITELVLGPELGQCCGGRVELWLERLTRADLPWLNDAANRMREGRGAADIWVIASTIAGTLVTHQLLRRPFAGASAVELGRDADGRMRLLELLRRRRPDLWIFGAGHVGQALVRLLGELGLFEITWIDSRAELLPGCLPDGIKAEACTAPTDRVAGAPAGTRFVVLTHDHALDYELCRLILARGDSSWLGLIGSASKSARFRSRLLRDGLPRETVSRLTCPIGVPGISSKLPSAIAIAIAAQLLQQTDAVPAAQSTVHPAAHGASSSAETHPPGCTGDCGSCGSELQKRT